MNGAESLVRTLLACEVETCFANPGTSEMHFVAALDAVPGMRCVLGLAEGVVTGCADGYGRMAGRPAATLLHCGPGFANGIANLHNAKRAFTPVVNIVGDHATYHRQYDPPLASDVEGLARPVSHWVRTSTTPGSVGADAAAAVQAARTPPGQVATLVLPADASWDEGGQVARALAPAQRRAVDAQAIRAVAEVLRREACMLLLGDAALGEAGLAAAWRIAQATGARLRTTGQVRRMARGRGRPPVDRVPYVLDKALDVFRDVRHLVLAGARPPAQFFAYPGRPSLVYPPEASVHVLARIEEDQVAALEALADEIGAPRRAPLPHAAPQAGFARGPFEAEAFGAMFGALLPEGCIVAEDAVTSGRSLFAKTFDSPPHDWLQITGGAIGHGFPCATGAAVAAPDRTVVCLQADGGGMYSLQALWTQARERLDVVNVVFANRAYRILQGELVAVGAKPGPASKDLFDLGRPDLDWVRLAEGMGVEAKSVDTLEAFADVFRAACARRGPFLIEMRI
ncbi:MAG TPA: acetolactate synthase large subunit [Usitatibacter sp.]|nr:acetolactate synthase large subunit [Usitatibacter sp.]